MLNGYRTLAATGAILGVTAERVLEFIEHGPLIGRELPEGLMVHAEDLALFRRPLGTATTGYNPTPNGGELSHSGKPEYSALDAFFKVTEPLIIRPCGEERWAPVAGSDRHEVSTLGRVRSWFNGKRKQRLDEPLDVKPRAIGEGYLGFGRCNYVHRAVLEAFVGPRPEGSEAAHHNGNKHDNLLENLRWATHAENIADKVRHGTCSAHGKQLTREESAEIRRRRESGESRDDVAEAFGVTPQTISNHTRLRLVRPVQP